MEAFKEKGGGGGGMPSLAIPKRFFVNILELRVYYCRRTPISGLGGGAFSIVRMNLRPVYLQLVHTRFQGLKHPDVCEANREDYYFENVVVVKCAP